MSESKTADLAPKGIRYGGRGPGTPNKVTAATRERIESEADPIGFLASIMLGEPIKAAPVKDGESQVETYPTVDQRVSAARILADKLVPNAKSKPITLQLPTLSKAEDLPGAIAALLADLAAGRITPDDATTVAGILETSRRAIETVELERRLADLEARQGSR